MADDDLVSNVKITGVDEATAQFEKLGDKGAEAFDKVAAAAAVSGATISKATDGIQKDTKAAGASINEAANAGGANPPAALSLKEVTAAGRELGVELRRGAKDLLEFTKRVVALATAGTLAVAGIAKLGASVAAQVNQTTSAFEQNNAAQQRAVASNLTAEQSAIRYASQQQQLNRQLATGAIDYETYAKTLKSNQQAYADQIKVTNELQFAEESAREETERLQKTAADRKAYTALTDTFGGPLTSSLIALGNVTIALKNKFLDAFGPGAAAFVDTLTKAFTTNGTAIGTFFEAAGAKLSAFIAQNGPAIEQALASIGSAVSTVFNGLLAAAPQVLAFFNDQLVPAFRAVSGFVDGLVQGFNKLFGTNFTTGAVVVIVALTSMVGGFKLLFGTIGLVTAIVPVLTILFSTLLGPILLLVAALVALYLAVDWQALAAKATAAGAAIVSFFTSIPGKISGIFASVVASIGSAWDTAVAYVLFVWQKAIDFFTGLPDTIGAIFTSVGKSIQDAFTAAFDFVVGKIKAVANSIIGFLQPVIDMIKTITGFGGGGGDSSTPAPAFASGGSVHGPGTSTSDSIFARLSNKEFVMQAKAVRRYGTAFMRAVNSGSLDLSNMVRGFASGGLVGQFNLPSLSSLPESERTQQLRPLSITIGDRTFSDLLAPENVVDSLKQFATQKQTRSAGRRPAWNGA